MELNRFLLKGSLILLVTFGLFNLFNFIFQLTMARLLSVAEYGILAALFSIIYVLNVFSESIQLIITKYTASNKTKGEVKTILNKSVKKSLKLSCLLFVLYLIVAVALSVLLEIEYPVVALSGVMIFFLMMVPITRGILQGRKRFTALGVNMVFESLLKLGLGIVFVLLGFGIYGALGAVILGSLAALFLSLLPLREIIHAKGEPVKLPELYSYSLPVFIIIACIVAFYTFDIIIAKMVFSPEDAGIYAIASILAKTIFWGTQPVSRAMFPLSSENTAQNIRSKNTYINSILVLSCLIAVALLLFYFVPDFIVTLFSGKHIPSAYSILFYLGVGTSVISFANLHILYGLSLGKIKRYWVLPIIFLIEVVLLFYSSHSLAEFSFTFMASSFLLLLSVLVISKL